MSRCDFEPYRRENFKRYEFELGEVVPGRELGARPIDPRRRYLYRRPFHTQPFTLHRPRVLEQIETPM